MMADKLKISMAYVAKRWTLKRLKNKADVKARQQHLLAKLQIYAVEAFPFYRNCKGVEFKNWPIIDKAIMLHEFGDMNAHGISREEAWGMAEQALAAGNNSAQYNSLTIGTSTGTSGQRGLFLVSADERALWLGSILARCVPDFPFMKHRVAVMLATGNDLYKTTSASGRLAFQFFDLKQGLEIHFDALQKFAPDILIAPPKAAAALANAKLPLKLAHIFTGGEVLDELDAAPIAKWFGCAPHSIYQATEGFLGVACAAGHIHLNEDDMMFEEEPVAGHPNHFVPIITDLRRRAQAMIRYRLNDVLVKLDAPCPCGSPLMALKRVEGRCDDVLHFKGTSIMPDALRAVILDADRSIVDFRLVQKFDGSLELRFPAGTSSLVANNAKAALAHFLEPLVGRVKIKVTFGIALEHARKLRRITCEIK